MSTAHVPHGPTIAAGATVDPSALLSPRTEIEIGATVEKGVVFADDEAAKTLIRANVCIGAGAVIAAGVEIGLGAHVLPGTVVVNSVPPNAVVQGNPAQIIGYVSNQGEDLPDAQVVVPEHSDDRQKIAVKPLGVGSAALYLMPKFSDLRGSLTVGELDGDFPFPPQRYFIAFDVPSEKLRGEHAHKKCEQFLICVRGSCRALLDDGENRKEVLLDRPDVGLYMPAMIWGTQYRYTRDAVLVVLASHLYDSSDYIRSYDEFLFTVGRRND